MAYYKKPANSTEKKASVYDIVSDRIISFLEKGQIPWQKPSNRTPAINLVSKKTYRGINTMLLGCNQYSNPYWLSYKQAKDLGGFVNSGEKSHIVVFWTQFKKDKLDRNGNKVRDAQGNVVQESIPCLRYYSVFNVEQCTIPEDKLPAIPAREAITAADSVPKNFADAPEVEYGNFDSSRYSFASDTITMPVLENFNSTEDFHASMFHELVHSTGHSKRLNRKESAETREAAYGREELIAEIGSAFLCYEAGIESTIPNQAAYIANWLNALKEDKRMIVVASGAAQKAVELILKDNKTIEQIVHEEGSEDLPEAVGNEDIYAIL